MTSQREEPSHVASPFSCARRWGGGKRAAGGTEKSGIVRLFFTLPFGRQAGLAAHDSLITAHLGPVKRSVECPRPGAVVAPLLEVLAQRRGRTVVEGKLGIVAVLAVESDVGSIWRHSALALDLYRRRRCGEVIASEARPAAVQDVSESRERRPGQVVVLLVDRHRERRCRPRARPPSACDRFRHLEETNRRSAYRTPPQGGGARLRVEGRPVVVARTAPRRRGEEDAFHARLAEGMTAGAAYHG